MGAETPKQFLELDGTPIVILSLRRIAACPQVTDIIVATRADEVARLEQRIKKEKFKQAVRVVKGGDSRQDSVAAALREVANGTEIVLVHDAVRPFVDEEIISAVIDAAVRHGAAIAAVPAVDTIKQVERTAEGAVVRATIPRAQIVMAQTPQGFRYDILKKAFSEAASVGFTGTDEASLVERSGHEVAVIMGSPRNIKITTPADLELAEFFMEQEKAKA